MRKIILLCAIFSLLNCIACSQNETLSYPDGSEYVGGVKDGKPHGQGRWTSPDGTKYTDQFKDGEYVGP